MKKSKAFALHLFIYSFLLSTLFLSTTLPSNASISTNVKVYIDGKLMEFGREANDPGPYIRDGRTLIPLRRIFEALDMEVLWDDKERMVTATGNDIEMKLYINKTIAYVNGKEETLDVPAEITDDRTFVPLRFVSENCGAEVEWDDSTKSVFITLPKEITSPEDDVPGGSGSTDVPVVERKNLGEEVTYNGMTFSFDLVEMRDVPGNVLGQLYIEGKTNIKNSTLLLEVFDQTNYSIRTRAYAQPSDTGIYDFVATFNTSKSFVPSYMYVYASDKNGNRILIGKYKIWPYGGRVFNTKLNKIK